MMPIAANTLAIGIGLLLAFPAFAQPTAPRGEVNSSNMSPPSGNTDGGHGIGTVGSNTANNGTASSTINPGNSSLAAAPKSSAAPGGGLGGKLENEPAVGGGSQGAGTTK